MAEKKKKMIGGCVTIPGIITEEGDLIVETQEGIREFQLDRKSGLWVQKPMVLQIVDQIEKPTVFTVSSS